MRGYFGIGIHNTKTEINVGTLWRHAYLYGAAFIFTIGKRYKKQCSDTQQTYRHTPLWQFDTFEEFRLARLYDCQLVAIEMCHDATPLPEFKHPKRTAYILGAEDYGLPEKILSVAQHIIQIPSMEKQSMNVATAGTIVMYDRFIKGKGK